MCAGCLGQRRGRGMPDRLLSGRGHASIACTQANANGGKPDGSRHDAQGEAAGGEGARHGARRDHAAGARVRGRGRQGRPLDLHQAPGGDPRGPQGQGARAGLVELLADRQRQGLWADHGGICLPRRGDGLVAAGARDLQLLRPRHRQHGSDRALRLAGAEGEMAEAPAGGQDPLRLHYDGARRRLLRCHQPRARRQARRRRVGAQRREVVRLRRRRSALQDLHRHGLHRSAQPRSTASTRRSSSQPAPRASRSCAP